MAIGINFRNDLAYVTDGPNEVWADPAGYPVTRGGITFGFNDSYVLPGYNNSTTVDVRLAGMVAVEPGGTVHYFRVDLPEGPGTYDIGAALGSWSHDGYMLADFGLQDGTVEFHAIGPTTPPNNNFHDAAGNLKTSAADWVSANSLVRHTFTDSYLRLRLTADADQYSAVMHIFISDKIPDGVETWHPTESAASGSNHGALSLTPPADATSATGHTVGATALDNYSRMSFGVERAAATFGGTAQPSSGPDNALGDCFRTPTPKSGSYAAGDWTLTLPVRASTLAAGQDGRWRARLWRSANADGSSATELTAGATALSEVTDIATGADSTSAGTIALGAVALVNEYVFIQLAWHVTGAAAASTALPTYKASGTFTAGVGAIAPPYPTAGSAPVAGDIALLVVESENQAISLSAAEGFAELTGSPQSAGSAATNPGSRLAVYWKRCVGGDTTPTVADSGDHQTGQIHLFSGVRTSGDPWDVTAAGNDSAANDTTGVIPGATTTLANCLVVLLCSTSFNGNSTAQFTAWANADLANLTERADNSSTQGLGGGHGMATGEKAAAGAYGSTTVTLANTSFKGAFSIALAPADGDASGADVLLRVGAASSIVTPSFTESVLELFPFVRPLLITRQSLHRASRW